MKTTYYVWAWCDGDADDTLIGTATVWADAVRLLHESGRRGWHQGRIDALAVLELRAVTAQAA